MGSVEENVGRERETRIFIPSWIGAMLKRGRRVPECTAELKQCLLRASILSRDEKMALLHADI